MDVRPAPLQARGSAVPPGRRSPGSLGVGLSFVRTRWDAPQWLKRGLLAYCAIVMLDSLVAAL